MQALRTIAQETYPDRRIPSFTLEISDKPRKNILGDWTAPRKNVSDARIRLFWMDRPIRYVILTAIHELAHHCDYMLHGEIGHQQSFYQEYTKLLATACQMGIFTKNMVEGLYSGDCDGGGDLKLVSHMKKAENDGVLSFEAVPDREYIKGKVLFCAYNAFQQKDLLKENGFRYNSRSHGWEKIVEEAEHGALLEKLSGTGLRLVTTNVLETAIDADIIVEGRTYDVRNDLSKMGYRYNEKSWHKRVPINDLRKECELLYDLRLRKGVDIRFRYSY